MEPRPPSPRSPDVCYGDWDCIEEEQQWIKDHPDGKISKKEQRAMDEYASESSGEEKAPYIDLHKLARKLAKKGWKVEIQAGNYITVSHRKHSIVYNIVGDDEFAEGCAYFNGVMVDWESLMIIKKYLKKWAKL